MCAAEQKRGCGYRKVGGLYLVGSGMAIACDRMPYPISTCPVCGEGIKFTRAPRQIDPGILFGQHENCRDDFKCHMCQPEHTVAYLLGVGKEYSPQSFIQEATCMGVSKRIQAIPKNLKIGETWIYLVHRQAIVIGEKDGKPTYQAGIFYAFKPRAIEMPIWYSEATPEKIEELQKRGISPVVFPDGDKDHEPKKK